MIRKEGFVDVDSMHNKQIKRIIENPNRTKILINFDYNGIDYFYKYNVNGICYNELVAEELAKDFGISCVDYDLATFDGKLGVISKNYKKEGTNYITIEELLSDCYDDRELELHNNLPDLWNALEYRYWEKPNGKEIISDLMSKIVNIFLFDILSCQYDRHSENFEIMESLEGIDISPLYDNEGILVTSGKTSFVAITLQEKRSDILWNVLDEFQKISSKEFTDIIKEKLWIISEENLYKIFDRIEKKTGNPIPSIYKRYYLEEYQNHLLMLEKSLKENIRKK